MIDLNSTLSRDADIVSEVFDGEAVLLVTHTASTLALNRTATRIWSLIDGRHTLAEVADAVAAEFAVSRSAAAEDVLSFVRQLAEREIVRLEPS